MAPQQLSGREITTGQTISTIAARLRSTLLKPWLLPALQTFNLSRDGSKTRFLTFARRSQLQFFTWTPIGTSSTKTCLTNLFDRVAPGGIIILDDYFTWDGCSRALHDFLSERSAAERLRSLGDICYLQKVGQS